MTAAVLTADAYDPVSYDAVLIGADTVVCIGPGDGSDDEVPAGDVRVVPVGNVIHVDGAHDAMVPGSEIDDDFYGGCEYAFLDFEAFPEARTE